MKKIIIISALVFILCGCSLKKDKYSNYEHYNLNNYNHKTYKYIRDYEGAWHDIKTEEYAVSSLCPIGKNEDICEHGILYNVGDYDFILLDKFSGCDGSASDEKETVFYKDKIYILRSFASIIEYTLNKENTEKKN